MVSAIASQTLTGTDLEGPLNAFRQRLAVFGNAHDILTSTTWATAEIHDVVDTALRAHAAYQARVSVTGPQLTIGSKQAVSLALAIHELATNAIKYGALSNADGTIAIAWQLATDPDQTFTFEWTESGGPIIAPPTRRGFGSRLVERVLRADFNSPATIAYPPTGLTLSITTPAANLQDATPNKVGLVEG